TETVDGTDFTFTFSRTGDTFCGLSVHTTSLRAWSSDVCSCVDLQALTGTITFAAGSSTAVLQFSATDDAIIENTELFSVIVGVEIGRASCRERVSAGGWAVANDN